MDNRSHDYTVVRLDRDKSGEWRPLSSAESASGRTQETSKDERGDVAFEYTSTGAIVSLNSVCREYREASLDELSKYLLMGLNTRGQATKRDLEVDGTKALESTVEASMNQRQPSGETGDLPVRVRTVVLRKGGCTYDLMYIARPQVFENLLPHFERFLKGFHAE